jgi:hypothetical protein
MSNRKLEIVQRLLDSTPEQQRETIDQAMITWWTNIRDQGGLRLTLQGYNILNDVLKLESWVHELADPNRTLTKNVILGMDRKLEWPYYIDVKKKRVIFFGSREAMMASMYGDLGRWISNIP